MTKSIPIIGIVLMLIGACTSVSVKPLNPTLGVSHVCIKENSKVAVSDFVNVIRDGFDRHGITTQVFEGPTPSGCDYILTYTALRSWDFAPYLSHAELRIERNYRQVAFAEYHLNGKGDSP